MQRGAEGMPLYAGLSYHDGDPHGVVCRVQAVKGPNTLGNQDDGKDALSQTDSSSPSSDATLVGSGSQPPGSNAYV